MVYSKKGRLIGTACFGFRLRLKVKEVSHEWEQLNKNKPLWMRKSEDGLALSFKLGCVFKFGVVFP